MGHSIKRIYAALLVLAVLLLNLKLNAQTSLGSPPSTSLPAKDVPRTLSYQGMIKSSGGTALNGTHQITTSLFADPNNAGPIWQQTFTVEVKDGLFSVILGSGANPLPDNLTMDRPLWIGISIDGSAMQQLTQLTAAPYALNVPNNSITFDKLSNELQEGILNAGNGKGATTQAVLSDPCLTNSDGGNNKNVVAGGCSNAATGGLGYASIIGGLGNSASANYSTASGGQANTASNVAATVGGGNVNTASGSYSTVAGGDTNKALGDYSFVGGGHKNTATGNYSTISGGATNNTLGRIATIGGGTNNAASADYSTIGGGENNTSSATDATVAGGTHNIASGQHTAIVGGETNFAGATDAFVGGGKSNLDSNTFTVIAGGNSNHALGAASSIGGGAFNRAVGDTSTIGGGDFNATFGAASTIGGGSNNLAGTNATVAGGMLDSAFGTRSFIGGGAFNQITQVSSVIAGGDSNIITNRFSTNPAGEGTSWHTIGGGHDNAIIVDINAGFGDTEQTLMGASTIAGGEKDTLSGPFGFIGGGKHNVIGNEIPLLDDDGGDIMLYDVIVGGNNNSIDTASTSSSIGGGSGNHISGKGTFVSPGNFHKISSSDNSAIGGGNANTIKSSYATIGGGQKNMIDTASHHAFLGGGEYNYIDTSSDHAFLGGGANNFVNSAYSVIVGGDSNTIGTGLPPKYSFIGAGIGNEESSGGLYNVITGGTHNMQDGYTSFIGGGERNRVGDNSAWNVLTGGYENYVGNPYGNYPAPGLSYSSELGGQYDTVGSSWATLGGGYLNKIDSGAQYSFIGGGQSNLLRSTSGVIAGGNSNTIQPSSGTSVIVGGQSNLIDTGHPYSTIGGGRNNSVKNNNGAEAMAIPGGDSLVAQSYGQTVMGFYNIPKSSSTSSTINTKDRVVIVGSGDPTNTGRKNAFEVSNRGESIVYNVNGSGGSASTDGGGSSSNGGPPVTDPHVYNPQRLGGTHQDNVIYAWGDVEPNNGFWDLSNPESPVYVDDALDNNKVIVHGDFGVKSVSHLGPGHFRIKLNIDDPFTDPDVATQFANNIVMTSANKFNPNGSTVNQQVSIVATIIYDAWKDWSTATSSICTITGPCACAVIQTTRMQNNTFDVYINCANSCDPIDRSFNFMVTGRPNSH